MVYLITVAADQGLEPQYRAPEARVLPLDESALRLIGAPANEAGN